MKRFTLDLVLALLALAIGGSQATAGPVFLTGHDPDFHAQVSLGAQNLLRTGLSYVTNGTYNSGVQKFLWVEAQISPPAGHFVGENGLIAIGLVAGTHYDAVDATGLATVNFSAYSAIAVASSFGGLLSQAELNGLIARQAAIHSYVNSGGGLLALSECAPTSGACLNDLLDPSPSLFGFLPITVSSVDTFAPYTVTPFGAGLGLTDGDVNDATHNSFELTGGLNVVDRDFFGRATTLAGIVGIGDGGFTPEVPEPSTVALFGAGAASLWLASRRRG